MNKPNAYQEAIRKRDAARAAAAGHENGKTTIGLLASLPSSPEEAEPEAKVAKPTAQPRIKTVVKKPTPAPKKAKK